MLAAFIRNDSKRAIASYAHLLLLPGCPSTAEGTGGPNKGSSLLGNISEILANDEGVNKSDK